MKLKLPWKKPQLIKYGSTENVQQRISSLQRRIAILHNNYRMEPFEKTKQSIEVYEAELKRLQVKYSKLLKAKVYVR